MGRLGWRNDRRGVCVVDLGLPEPRWVRSKRGMGRIIVQSVAVRAPLRCDRRFRRHRDISVRRAEGVSGDRAAESPVVGGEDDLGLLHDHVGSIQRFEPGSDRQ